MESRGKARANDGYELAVTRFPAQGDAWGTMLIIGAMGVRQDFYAPLARFFAANGIHVLAFDYRGMGWSRAGGLRGFEATLTDWATQDMDAMLAEARKPAPHLPLLVLGHSLGGQFIALAPRSREVAALLTVTAGSGWFRHNHRIPVRVRLFWFVMIPLLTPIFGYFPGKALRMVGELPRGVAWRWRRWCLHPEYLMHEGESARAALAGLAIPIRGYSFEDDDIVTRPAIDQLHGFYSAARLERAHVRPADIGERRIGHFGFFHERSRATFWPEALAWLSAKVVP